MNVILGLDKPYLQAQPKVVTIGNFDGMHRGHRALIKKVVDYKEQQKCLGGLMTFEPHPLKVLAPQRDTKSIFDLADRIQLAGALGLDFFIVEPFSRELSELEPEQFFNKILLEKLNTKFLFVGHDFTFGRDRRGTLDVLKAFCEKAKVHLEILTPVKINGDIVSSTKIREAISKGDVERAQSFLGRPFSISGVIEKGAGRGKSIGFATANLFTSQELFPAHGVYATIFEVKGHEYKSVTNVGENPTFLEERKRLVQVETHILNFNEDIYGESAKVNFIKFLRPEMKFGSVENLVAQIKKDVQSTKDYQWPK